ncbi:DUF1450 domain-containing protein [Tumebacillus lipolyticus]|uniref:DUF1450 domain-containing protein n=1 Tax=Tumebacillus lipolyticus TaxID=1280370 RepID=A0ABW4ZT41_9BACL
MTEVEKQFVLECCSSNMFLDDIATIDWLSATYPELSIEPDGCLDRCGICIRYAYVVINDDFLYANSVSELKDQIVAYIENHRQGLADAKQILDGETKTE